MIIPFETTLPDLRMSRCYSFDLVFPFDTTGMTARMQVRQTADKSSALVLEPVLTATSEGATSTWHVEVSEVASAALPRLNRSYPFEFVFHDTLGCDVTYITGLLPVIVDLSEVPA